MPGSTAAQAIARAAERLREHPNPQLDAELLLRGVTGLTRVDLLTHADEPLALDHIAAFESAVARRALHEPLQYILGKAHFWRDEFLVTPAVLIPRPDTETLVESVAARLRSSDEPYLLDIGTGSGCVALSLLRELPGSRAFAVDVSEKALEVARQNATNLGLSPRIEFAASRWFAAVSPEARFDAIVSNPPYVARADEASLAAEVRDFEPALALFANDDDDLSSYRAIVTGIGLRLKPFGLLAFEVGLGQADRVATLLSENDFESIEILNDLASIPRVVIGRQT